MIPLVEKNTNNANLISILVSFVQTLFDVFEEKAKPAQEEHKKQLSAKEAEEKKKRLEAKYRKEEEYKRRAAAIYDAVEDEDATSQPEVVEAQYVIFILAALLRIILFHLI